MSMKRGEISAVTYAISERQDERQYILKPLKNAGKMHASAGNRAAGAKLATGMNDATIYCVAL